MPYTAITDIRDAAIRLHLDGSTYLAYLPIDVLAEAYNGTGPEFLPERLRDLLDGACRPFLPAVMIHDVDFTFSDGSVRSFRQANRRLLANCVVCAMDAHPWTSWRRYALVLEAWAMYRAVSHPQFGWVAWTQAHYKKKRKEKPMSKLMMITAMLGMAIMMTGCGSPRVVDAEAKGMYVNAATETLAIGAGSITTIPAEREAFAGHYKEDTAWLAPSTKTHQFDVFIVGSNATSQASTVVKDICQAFGLVAPVISSNETSRAGVNNLLLPKSGSVPVTTTDGHQAEVKCEDGDCTERTPAAN